MDEQSLLVDHIFLLFSQQCLQFSHVHPSQIHLREYQAVDSPDCILPPFSPSMMGMDNHVPVAAEWEGWRTGAVS